MPTVRELSTRLSLSTDFASFAKGAAAGALLAKGLEVLIDKSVELAGQFVENL